MVHDNVLLRELSDDEDAEADVGPSMPEDPKRPWLQDFHAYLNAHEQVPDGQLPTLLKSCRSTLVTTPSCTILWIASGETWPICWHSSPKVRCAFALIAVAAPFAIQYRQLLDARICLTTSFFLFKI